MGGGVSGSAWRLARGGNDGGPGTAHCGAPAADLARRSPTMTHTPRRRARGATARRLVKKAACFWASSAWVDMVQGDPGRPDYALPACFVASLRPPWEEHVAWPTPEARSRAGSAPFQHLQRWRLRWVSTRATR